MTPEELEKRVNLIKQMRTAIVMQVKKAKLSDEEAVKVASLYDDWSDTATYEQDDIVRYNNHLYRCISAAPFQSQATWTPDVSPSLWDRIDIAEDGIEIWTAPSGAHDAYDEGDKVHWPTGDSTVYVSKRNGNIWEPAEGGNEFWDVFEG